MLDNYYRYQKTGNFPVVETEESSSHRSQHLVPIYMVGSEMLVWVYYSCMDHKLPNQIMEIEY